MTGTSRRGLAPATVLRRAPELSLRIDARNVVHAEVPSGSVDCGLRGLAILDAFVTPTTLEEALQSLEATTEDVQDWVDVTTAIVTLHEAGVLVDGDADGVVTVADGGFSDPMTHAVMLNDRRRTSAYLRAIDAVVGPGDVVVDVGTGSGVLALASVRAGADRVYAVEASRSMAALARRTVERNGMSDRVKVLEGWSSHVRVPERATVMVSEIIGDDPLREYALEATLDARRRFLGPEPRLIPTRLRIVGVPVEMPPEQVRMRTIDEAATRAWQEWYGFDLSPLAEGSGAGVHALYVTPSTARSLRRLSDPVLLAEVDFATVDTLKVEATRVVEASAEGRIGGVLIWFELDLAPGVSLSSAPDDVEGSTSWRNPLWYADAGVGVSRGDRFTVSYAYRSGGADGVTVSAGPPSAHP